MSKSKPPARIADNIAATLARSPYSPEEAAAATGLEPESMRRRLDGREEFRVSELLRLGGLLKVDPVEFLAGAA